MTGFFWRKRPSKKITATLLFLAVLVIIFVYRRPIAIKGIEHFTQPQNLSVTCLDFSFGWQLNLNIKQACISSPIGSIVLREGVWQPWSNALTVEQIKIKHVEQLATANNVDEAQTKELDFPSSLPKLSISNLEIDSFVLFQPLHLSVNTTSNNKLSITGDVNASIRTDQNTLVGNIEWRLSDLTKWLPQAHKLYQDNAELLKKSALDKAIIKTNLTFDGKVLHANNSLDIVSRFDVSTCPIDAAFKGNLLVELNISSLNINVDLSQFSNTVSVVNCLLLQDYFAKDDMPQLSFILPQKVAISETQISLPELQIVDKQNTHRSIILNALNYKMTGELDVNYNISLKQPIKTTQLQAEMLNFQGNGKLTTDLSTLNKLGTERPISFQIDNDKHQLIVSDFKMNSLLVGNLTSEFTFHHSSLNQLELKGKIDTSDIQMGNINLAKTSGTFSLTGVSFNDLQLRIDNQLQQFSLPDISVRNITNHIDLNIKNLEELSFSGNSIVSKLSMPSVNFLPITVAHTGQANLVNTTVSSQHEISLKDGFMIELEQQQTHAKVQINQQKIISLQSIITQLQSALIIKEGNLSANIELTLPQEGEPFIAQGNADFQGISVKYQDYLLNNVTYQTPLTFDSAGLQLAESTLYIDSIDVGVAIEQVEANVIAQNNVVRLTHAQGEILNGKFSLSELWLDGRAQRFNVNFENIDLAKLVALQQQPGIKITGSINGDIPLIMDKQGIRVEDGWMSSLTGGKLTIINNPSFDSIKEQQPELALLENLDFTQLESTVKLNPDGWVFFDFSLQGNNPDKKQSVNFNYTHQENILALLESIRLVKSVENKIEQKITQGDKK